MVWKLHLTKAVKKRGREGGRKERKREKENVSSV